MEKDIIKILASYLRYWYLFLIGAVICLAIAFFYLRYNVTPEYYIGGKILLNDKEQGGGAGGMESFNSLGLIKMSQNIQDEIGVLQSYDLMKSTIDELGFAVGYYMEGRFSEIEVYESTLPFKVVLNDSLPLTNYGTFGTLTIVDEYSFNIETVNDDDTVVKKTYDFGETLSTDFGTFSVELKSGNLNFKSQSPVVIRFRNPDNIASNYNNKLQIYPVYENGGGLLEIGLTDAIPERGVDLINKLIDVYARNSAEHKNVLSRATLKLIDERLELLITDLDSAEKGVESYKQSNALTDVSSDASRFIQLADETDRQLAQLRTEISALEALEVSLRQSSNSNPIMAYNINNAVLSNSIVNYNLALQKRNALVQSSGTGNPQLIEIDRELNENRSIIAENVRGIKLQLTRNQRDLMNKSSQYRSKISSVPTAERALQEINRDQGLKQNLYLFLLQKREEEALSVSVPFSDTRIIEYPKSTNYPINGAKTPIYLGALLFGLFVPFVWIFVKDKLNTKITSREDIEALTDTPILGAIAASNEKDVVVVKENNVAPVAELFRLMRHNLKFLSQGKEKKVFMVTSSKQGEGKTFIAINLAASLAITGKKAVVIGFDLRAPKLMKELSSPNEIGVSDYIIDKSLSIQDIITPYQNQKNMFLIGSGSIPPNPGELMLSERIEELVTTLKNEYDYIVLDTPPIGKVADAYSLSNLVDTTLYVVRHNYTNKEDLNIINDISDNKKLDPLMIVLNDIKMDKAGVYSYGYGNNLK
ncbi:GumC family protein [Neotamlana sedimentorum]|uniref:GumC family protein n=1 Tax=Neotamlana sedimentorum TaxID=1435349 RepID=UPI0005CBA016|nr:tyrosine-protein kinase family protein [Tamlana sedimentorum]